MSLLLACAGRPTAPEVDPPDAETGVDTATDSPADTADTVPPDTDTDIDTGPNPDEDGDGHASLAAGGDDCDDTDPWTWPGAQEWCDDTDQDCDGDPLAEGVCALTQPLTTRATRISDSAFLSGMMIPVRDLTGDGLDDMLVWSGGGATAVAAGDGTLGAFQTWTWVQEWSSVGDCDHPDGRFDVGDLDGDGFNDVALQEEVCHPGIEIYWGPITEGKQSDWPDGWNDPDQVTTSASSTFRVMDVDRDGFTDFARTPVLDLGGALVLYYGGSRDERIATVDDGGVVFGTFDFGEDLGDVDGDGLGDIAWVGTTRAVWLSGADIPTSGIASLTDVGYGTFTDDDLMTDLGSGYVPMRLPVGDLTGDGRDDVIVAVGDRDELPDGGLLYYDTFQAVDTAPTGIVSSDAEISQPCDYPAILHDGGSPAGIFCNSGTTHLVLPLEWRTGTWSLADLEFIQVDHDTGDPGEPLTSLYGWGLGDLDGDGWSDVVAKSRVDTWVLDAFDDIPWNNDQYW